jgi:hypothetical protein
MKYEREWSTKKNIHEWKIEYGRGASMYSEFAVCTTQKISEI